MPFSYADAPFNLAALLGPASGTNGSGSQFDGTTLTFSFSTNADPTFRAIYLAAFAELSQFLPITFVQMPDEAEFPSSATFTGDGLGGTSPDLRLSQQSDGAGVGGEGFWRFWQLDGDTDFEDLDSLNRIWSVNHATILHELGHALTLDHPSPNQSPANATFLTAAEQTNNQTVMHYDNASSGTDPAHGEWDYRHFQLLDVYALQARFGSNMATHAGDSVHTASSLAADQWLKVLWDAGGADIIDMSGEAATQYIDLAEGGFSTIGPVAGNNPAQYNLAIAYGAQIEHAAGGSGADQIFGNALANTITGNGGNDVITGGGNVDTVVYSQSRSAYTITQLYTGVFRITGPDGTDKLAEIEYARFADQTLRLLPGNGITVDFAADPASYMAPIRDFDGNDLGASTSWEKIGVVDANGDGDADYIYTNRAIGRFAAVATAPDGDVYFADHGWAGETRVVGIYVDPLVAAGEVAPGSDFDSQGRFQNDLFIGNIDRVLGGDDYDGDGLQEIYFALTDGTAYLHAYMHADGNIRYANYQSQQQVVDFLTGSGFGPATWDGWFA